MIIPAVPPGLAQCAHLCVLAYADFGNEESLRLAYLISARPPTPILSVLPCRVSTIGGSLCVPLRTYSLVICGFLYYTHIPSGLSIPFFAKMRQAFGSWPACRKMVVFVIASLPKGQAWLSVRNRHGTCFVLRKSVLRRNAQIARILRAMTDQEMHFLLCHCPTCSGDLYVASLYAVSSHGEVSRFERHRLPRLLRRLAMTQRLEYCALNA